MNATLPPEDRMVFLVGRGRSGTTLLRSMLDRLANVSVAPESLFVMNLYRAYRRANWNPERIRRFARDIFLEQRMRRWQVSLEGLNARWTDLETTTFAHLCADVYDAQADAAGKDPGRLLGDKNPHYALFVGPLMEIFPKARFVHLVRDYRDNVLSYQNVPFDLSSPGALAYRWKKYNEVVIDAAIQEPHRFHRLRFEDLVSAPEQTLAALCGFLGIEASATMLQQHEGENAGRPAWHSNLSKPVDPDLAGQWQTRISPKHLEVIDEICQPLGRQLGYAPVTSGSNGWSRMRGVALGSSVTALERILFKFPLSARSSVINVYRRLTGNVIR